MADKTSFSFTYNIETLEDFLEHRVEVICTDNFWNDWLSAELFYFGFNNLIPWYGELIDELNGIFHFLHIHTIFDVKTKYFIGYSTNKEEYLDTRFAVFNIEFYEDIPKKAKRQYSYIIQTIIRTINASRILDLETLIQIYQNENTPRLNLVVGISNKFAGHDRNLCNFRIKLQHILNLTNLEKGIYLSDNIPIIKQSNFIYMMSEENIIIPSKGDIVYIENEQHVIDTIFSLDFIKVLSLETGQFQFCNISLLEYRGDDINE